jgi:GNAT superfamily N-acetyltransferase
MCNGVRSQSLKYTIGLLNEKHLPLVMALQKVIIQHLQRPDLLQPFTLGFMKKHMGDRGIVLGVFVEDRLAAFRNVYYPEPWNTEWNLGLDLGLAQEDLTKVANLQMVCVHPDYRGNGLAMKMNQVSLGLLRKRGAHRHICATVSPYNIWNLPILLKSGFCIAALKSKYGGKLRYIVYQNLRCPLLLDDNSAVHVRLDDFQEQKRWLASGFCGVALCKRHIASGGAPLSSFDLVFKKPKKQSAAALDADAAHWLVDPLPGDSTKSIQRRIR